MTQSPSRILNGPGLYRRMAEASIVAQLRYSGTFAVQAIGNFVTTLLGFFGIWSLFHRFGSIAGWGIGTVAVLYGLVNVAFSLAETLGRGFEVFGGEYVRTGSFDRLLLRPRSTLLLLLGRELRLRPIGRFLQGLFVLVAGLWLAPHIEWSAALVLPWAIAGEAAMFSLNHADPLGVPTWIGAFSPAAGFVFLGVMVLAWNRTVAGYVSSGS